MWAGRDTRPPFAASSDRSSPIDNGHHHTTMTKHSKNNTASSIFSYAERKKLDYGTKGVRHVCRLVISLF
jgi:hypothetical protein